MVRQERWRTALKKAAKRRAKQPPRAVATSGSLKVSRGRERRIVDECLDVLQNIEAAFVVAWREADEVDDQLVARVLTSAILHVPSENPRVQWLRDFLGEIRDRRLDISDEVWKDCLRVVHRSLRRHSSCRPDETSYLEFAAMYVA